MKTVGHGLRRIEKWDAALHDSDLPADHPLVTTAWNALPLLNDNEDPDLKKDFCGALIRQGEYGNTESEYGWTVRKANRLVFAQLRRVSYLRACHVKNGKEGHFFVCSITSDGQRNIEWDLHAPLLFFPRS